MKEDLKSVKDAENQFTWVIFIFLGGILLPVITLGVEFTTHLCGENFFDPIPTLWHVLLVAFVPLSNSYLYYAVLKGRTERATGDENKWSCFQAGKNGENLKVCERIYTKSGKNWTDVSSWYWSALGDSSGEVFWAVTFAENSN